MEWINKKHLDPREINLLSKLFLYNKPFEHLLINNFLKKEKAIQLLKALQKEKFYQKESDLFKFIQTDDVTSTKNTTLKNFRNFLCSKQFISYIDAISNCRLKTKLDLAGTLYQDADFLLCHDDRLEGRKLAFILYLSTLNKKEGGSLNLFHSKNNTPTKISKKIIPKLNTFVLFKVSKRSFHEVEEVIVKKQRIALGGWLHGD